MDMPYELASPRQPRPRPARPTRPPPTAAVAGRLFRCDASHRFAPAVGAGGPDVWAATAPATATVVRGKRVLSPALAVLLAGHVIRDGEVVQLVLKPSIWFILLSSLKSLAGAAIFAIAAKLWLPAHVAWFYVQAAAFLAVARLMWATLQWVNRLYILTDMRVLRLSGVFAVDVFDCPLRRVGGTRVLRTFRERLLRLGSVEIRHADDQRPPGLWQTVAHPARVNEMVQEAARKAQHGGGGGGGLAA